jgi:tetrahydromethanopterin S-methyltransferase subunit C
MVAGSVVPILGRAQADFNADTLAGAVCMIIGVVIVALLGRMTKQRG